MIKTIQIQVDPECAEKKHLLIKKISEDLNIIKNEIKDLIILKKSIDACIYRFF